MNCPRQDSQPMSNSEEVLVEFDVKYLIGCLSYVRNTSYTIAQQPDVIERNAPHPDYLVRDNQTGHSLAIEHARFFESQKDREHVAAAVKKGDPLELLINPPTPKELGKRLSEFFDNKLAKGQFSGFGDCERILLAKNRWGGISVE